MVTKPGWNYNKNKNLPASEKRELAVYLKVLPRRKPRIESHNYLLYVFVFLLVWVWNNESNYKSCLIRMLIVFNAFKVSYKSVLYWLHPICLSFPSLNIILLQPVQINGLRELVPIQIRDLNSSLWQNLHHYIWTFPIRLEFPLGSNGIGLNYFRTQSPSLITLGLTPLLNALAIHFW